MSMRISDVGIAVLILLAGCGQGSDDPRVAAGALPDGAADRGRIACRVGGATAFSETCTAERTGTAAGQMLTLRGPDGGFHRIMVTAGGRAVATADGAEPAMVATGADGAMEIVVGGDRYRLPAVGQAPPAP